MSNVILQSPSTKETMLMTHLSCLSHSPISSIKSVPISDLTKYQQELRVGNVLPVGSVEFIRESMRVAGYQEPNNISYPAVLNQYLGRDITKRSISDVLETFAYEDVFIKPVDTKIFTGFVLQNKCVQGNYDEHDQEQFNIFSQLPRDTFIWVCKPFEFLCEWRYYVHNGSLIGSARYDHYGDDDAPDINIDIVLEAISQLRSSQNLPVNCAIDFGVSKSDGKTVLVECNDAWSLGLYGKALTSFQYFHLLRDRWKQIESISLLARKNIFRQ